MKGENQPRRKSSGSSGDELDEMEENIIIRVKGKCHLGALMQNKVLLRRKLIWMALSEVKCVWPFYGLVLKKVKLLLTLHGQVGEDAFLGCIMVLFKGPVQLWMKINHENVGLMYWVCKVNKVNNGSIRAMLVTSVEVILVSLALNVNVWTIFSHDKEYLKLRIKAVG